MLADWSLTRSDSMSRVDTGCGACESIQDCLDRSEEHTSELQSQSNIVCRLLLEKTKTAIAGSGSSTSGTTGARGRRVLLVMCQRDWPRCCTGAWSIRCGICELDLRRETPVLQGS